MEVHYILSWILGHLARLSVAIIWCVIVVCDVCFFVVVVVMVSSHCSTCCQFIAVEHLFVYSCMATTHQICMQTHGFVVKLTYDEGNNANIPTHHHHHRYHYHRLPSGANGKYKTGKILNVRPGKWIVVVVVVMWLVGCAMALM